MKLQLTVVFVFLPSLCLGAERGERCVNQWGEPATCTHIYSCKAAIDALSIANGSKVYAAGIVCGYDTEPLVCCRTLADVADTSVNNVAPSENDFSTPATSVTTESSFITSSSSDLNILTNVSALNNTVQVILELSNNSASSVDVNNIAASDVSKRQNSGMEQPTRVSVDERIAPNDKSTTSSTSDQVIYTSPLLVPTSEKTSIPSSASVNTNALFESTTRLNLNPSVSSSKLPDALPLQSNDSRSGSIDFSRFPEQPNSSAFPDVNSNILPDISQGLPLDIPTTPSTFSAFTETSFKDDTTKISINKLLPDRNTCGFQNERRRLANAPISTIDEFPWTALLKYEDQFGYDVGCRCVGTLINPRYVITAAHCLANFPQMFYLKRVRLGEWSLSSEIDCGFDYNGEECTDKVVDVGIEKSIPHPSYNPHGGNNNIALIRMERDVDYSVFIRPICLPVGNLQAPSDGTILTTAGWGATKNGVELDIKSKVHLPVLETDKCSNAVFSLIPVHEDQVCIGAIATDDICTTDSGGPVMAIDEETKPQWYLEGVIPKGFFCDRRGFLGIYSRVTEHISWILSTIEKDTL